MTISQAAHAAASPQPDFLDLSPEQLLNAEVVSVSKRPESVAESPAAVYVITDEDIARSGVTSVADALRMAPGVDVAQGDNNSWAINIRGFNKGLANQLLVMIDGRAIYNTLFAGTYWEVQNLPLENIARIEVVRGPGGTLWGANAVNGVINIITKSARDTQGNLVTAGAGSIMRDYGLAQMGGKSGNDTYYRVYGQHFNNGTFETPQGLDAQDDGRDTRAGFRVDHGENLTVSGDAYVNNTHQLVSIPQFTAPYSSLQGDTVKSQGANILAHWKKSFEDGGLLSIQSYLDYTVRDQLTLRDEESIADIDAQYNLPQYDSHEIVIGGGYRLTHEKTDNTPTLSVFPDVINNNVVNVFAQDKITLVPDRWYLTLGSKAEHNDFTGFEFEPSARLQWFPDKQQTIWASVSRAVRTPSPLERSIDLNAGVFPPGVFPVPTEFNLAGNPDFKSEQLIAYELGYRNQVTPDISLDVATFYNNYGDMAAQQLRSITADLNPPAHVLFTTEQANLMTAETYGVEVASEWNISPGWKISGGYSFLNLVVHLDNDFGGLTAEEHQSPSHQLNVRSHWDLANDWTLDASAYYVSRLSAYDAPAYLRVDANLGWRITDGMEFNLIGQNLLQDSHREFGNATDLNTAEVPRAVFGKMTWRF